MNDNLVSVSLLFLQMSLFAFGGANAILPELQRQVVEQHHMMSAQTFAALFALAQAAPGPNVMVVSLIGWHVAGLPGAVLSMVCIAGPSSVLTFLVARVWDRFRDTRWRRVVQKGLLPVTAGLLLSSGALLLKATTLDWSLGLLSAVVVVVLLTTKVNPMLVLGCAAALGALGVVG